MSLVDLVQQGSKATVGVTACETSRDISFCAHTILQLAIFEIPDATSDPRFADNPLIAQGPFIRFYAGMPLINPEGYALATLCVIDRIPRLLTDDHRQMLTARDHTQRRYAYRNDSRGNQSWSHGIFEETLLAGTPHEGRRTLLAETERSTRAATQTGLISTHNHPLPTLPPSGNVKNSLHGVTETALWSSSFPCF